jgi:ankyrin repeat protein
MKRFKLSYSTAAAVAALCWGTLVHAQNFEALQSPSPLGELVRGLDVNEQGPDGSTPLQWAVYDQDVARVRALIGAGADVTVPNKYGSNAMQLAAEAANEEIIQLLLDAGADADSPNPEGQTALMLVARAGAVDAARLLIRKGATIDARENWGNQTALMWATARRHPEMMKLLIKEGADINAISAVRDYNAHVTAEGRAKTLDSGGLTPLMYAIRENCIACVALLIESEVDLDLVDPDGVSPLLLAVLNTNWDIAELLIKAGADVNQWDMFGQAPLIAAVANRNGGAIKIDGYISQTNGLGIVEMLLDVGANPNMQLFLAPAKSRLGYRGTTPLIRAAANADVEVIDLLLQHGADATLTQADLQSALYALAGSGGRGRGFGGGAPVPESAQLTALQMLLDAGAGKLLNDLASPHHLQRNRGGSVVHAAANAGNQALLKALVEAGADINATDVDGLTALDYAEARGFLGFQGLRQPRTGDMADLLRSLGATRELDVEPFWPNIGPPFFYPWNVFPLDPETERKALVPGSIDHQ